EANVVLGVLPKDSYWLSHLDQASNPSLPHVVVAPWLREEWLQRLQSRNEHVNESMREEEIRKAQRMQEFLGLQRRN
ncbi:hypothetical protein NFI96_014923, partial [Prochilodus magdalenae]